MYKVIYTPDAVTVPPAGAGDFLAMLVITTRLGEKSNWIDHGALLSPPKTEKSQLLLVVV